MRQGRPILVNMTETVKSFAPYIRSRSSSAKMVWGMAAALLPVIFTAVFCYKGYAVRLMLVSVIASLAAECLACLILGKKPRLQDGSSLLYGLLLALLLPPALPLWMAAAAAAFGIIAAKEFYGGFAQNPFHPAVVGHVLLTVGFPITMNLFLEPFTFEEIIPPLLNANREWGAEFSWAGLLTGPNAGWIGSSSAAAILFSGLLLLWQRLIFLEVPLIFLGSFAALCALLGLPVEIHVLTGGAVFAAFFLVTDPVTTPHSRAGCRALAFTGGVLLALIRKFSVHTDGAAIVVLLASAMTPWFDEFFRPSRAASLRSGVPE